MGQLSGLAAAEVRPPQFAASFILEATPIKHGTNPGDDGGSMLEVIVRQRGRSWEWRVIDETGATLMWGREKTRQSASYHGHRALFQILAVGRKSNPAPLRR